MQIGDVFKFLRAARVDICEQLQIAWNSTSEFWIASSYVFECWNIRFKN